MAATVKAEEMGGSREIVGAESALSNSHRRSSATQVSPRGYGSDREKRPGNESPAVLLVPKHRSPSREATTVIVDAPALSFAGPHAMTQRRVVFE